MMLIDLYVVNKVRELEAERAQRASQRPQPAPVVGPLARVAGRALRRIGEGLESWAAPPVPESNAAWLRAARQTANSTFRSREEGC
jgi:hypothetical protein